MRYNFEEQNERWPVLLQASRDGDREASEELIQGLRPRLLEMAKSQMGEAFRPRCSPSDVVQETLMEAHKDFHKFKGNSLHELLAWVVKILRNNLRDLRRTNIEAAKRAIGREKRLEEEREAGYIKIIDPSPTPSTTAQREEEVEQIRIALDLLDHRERAVLILRAFEGFEFAMIGQMMGTTAEAARKLWKRSLLKLIKVLHKKHRTDT